MKELVCIIGTTASGKTALAVKLAQLLNGEIISADSRQVYEKMDIGTGKDLDEYEAENYSVPYHLINIRPPGYKYSVFEYQKDFYKVYADIIVRGKMPILCGGTGMYIEAVLKQYKLVQVPINKELRKNLSTKPLTELENILREYKKLHNISDIDNTKRAIRAIEIEEYYKKNKNLNTDFSKIDYIIFGIKYERNTRRKLITQRLQKRLKNGLIEEVESLLKSGLKANDLIYYGLEYKYITEYLLNKISYEDMIKSLNVAIHRYAKRQMTWFRRMERKNMKIFLA